MKRGLSPRHSIRLRLATLLAACLFLFGGTLLGVSYALVRSNLTVDPRRLAERAVERLRTEARPQLGDTAGRKELLPGLEITPAGRSQALEQIRVAQDELASEALSRLTVQYLLVVVAMALLAGGLGWIASGRVLRPMADITATARKVSQESLHERIALDGPEDELKRLADTFDSMLARLDASFQSQFAFVRNASHELRTPLAVIRTEADVTLADEADNPRALRQSLRIVREASERSERLLNALLMLARADRHDHLATTVDLAGLIRQAVETAAVRGPEPTLALEPTHVNGDPELLRTMVANLADNAVRHNAGEGWIHIRCWHRKDRAVLQFSNSSAPISPAEAACLTEPFRRLSTARTGEGLGLGLSVASSVARAHGGELEVEALPAGGLRVSVELPLRPADAARNPPA